MTVLRCLARRPAASALQAAAAAASRRQAPSFARSLYTVPSLDRHDQLVANGVPGLFSAGAFQTAFTEYQSHIVDRLNEATAGGTTEGQDVKALVIELARDPTRAHSFNLASMAFNNHFFFRGLHTHPDVVSQPSTDLARMIRDNFNSIDTLRDTFIATADSMFGPGFVWLVQVNDSAAGGPLRILPTYLAGSPLSGAHYRRQSHDLNTHNADSYRELNKVGSFGATAKQAPPKPTKPLGGTDVVPLLCVNTWEHAWLHDYGVAGKEAYLRAWWEKIDWDVVRQGATIHASEQTRANQFHYS